MDDIILIAVFLDTQAIGNIEVAASWKNPLAVVCITDFFAQVSRKGVLLDYERWFGRPIPKDERTALSRELARLEQQGYLVRSGGRRRTTHVRLTEAGRTMAEFILESTGDEEGPRLPPIDPRDYFTEEDAYER